MNRGPYKIIEDALKEAVPNVTADALYHQMEYLDVNILDDGYQLRGPGWKEPPVFLNSFVGMDKDLTPRIEEKLKEYYDSTISKLSTRVRKATESLGSQKIPADELWLSKKNLYPIKGHFLGLKIKWHDHDTEFVLSLTYGRAEPINVQAWQSWEVVSTSSTEG